MRAFLSGTATILLLALLAGRAYAVDVEVQALFTGAAMLKIQGASKLLKAGESHSGVTLIEADSRNAVLEIGGQRRTVSVSQRISSAYEAPSTQQVSIPRDSKMQYRSQAEINGRRVNVLVDTGANVVAMNAAQARSLGVDINTGVATRVETAAGVVGAWSVVLDSVDLGGIRVNNVSASVLEGDHPSVVLLGMTYLRHVDMQEKNGILLLSRDF